MSNEYNRIFHNIDPVYNELSSVLILGSFPSVKSREQSFFYGHPQNRFWKVISKVLDIPKPETIEQKKKLLLNSRIALWDVINSCEIIGSSDSSIRNVVSNDISLILTVSDVKAIILNGKTALKFYRKYFENKIDIEVICLPSTSAANAGYSIDDLVSCWKVIKKYIN